MVEYLKDRNATAAFVRAGYAERGAHKNAARLMANDGIRAAIESLGRSVTEKAVAELQVTQERVLAELARIAFSDPRRLYAADGSLRPLVELDDDTAATIASVEVLEEWDGRGEERTVVGATKKIKLWDKVRALQQLGEHLGLFRPTPKSVSPGTIEIVRITVAGPATPPTGPLPNDAAL